ncbi:MAG: sensor histidine kinase [Phycisphaerales bacterium]|nr:MAG: sensor histidine kinase [Phycisphaerales bacterium]
MAERWPDNKEPPGWWGTLRGRWRPTWSLGWPSEWRPAWPKVRPPRVSLANKCLLLFGGAVLLIVAVALTVPFLRMNALVNQGQFEHHRELVQIWLAGERAGDPERPPELGTGREAPGSVRRSGVPATRLRLEQARQLAENDQVFRRAIAALERGRRDEWQAARWDGGTRVYRYFLAERTPAAAPGEAPELVSLITLTRRSDGAAEQLGVNIVYLFSAGCLVLGLAVLVFYQVTHRLILSPVRQLRETAELVRDGHLDTRSAIRTGDEFEELAETFNLMLADMQTTHEQLRAINRALDLKLNELAKSNSTLHESARIKGEFLAKVSHELRTPMNSIIGFAELLLDIAKAEIQSMPEGEEPPASLGKRTRYLQNIVNASRSLLEMIESLLEMAKIEAGRVELRVEAMPVREVCEGLLGLISPLADRKGVDVRLELSPQVPVVETDSRKLQQIVFNLLSNAVKFIPSPAPGRAGPAGTVTLRVEPLPPGVLGGEERVRFSVIDTGPGIAPEDQSRIFEKFEQGSEGLSRAHQGTGLGLAIVRELAGVLDAELQLVSDLGRGSMFSVILPRKLDPARVEEAKLENAFRGALAGRRTLRDAR